MTQTKSDDMRRCCVTLQLISGDGYVTERDSWVLTAHEAVMCELTHPFWRTDATEVLQAEDEAVRCVARRLGDAWDVVLSSNGHEIWYRTWSPLRGTPRDG